MCAVIALTDETAEDLILDRNGADLGQRFDFGDRFGQRQRRGGFDAGRHDGIGQGIQRVLADNAQHLRDLGVVGADMAFDERGMVFEFTQGGSAKGSAGNRNLGHGRASSGAVAAAGGAFRLVALTADKR